MGKQDKKKVVKQELNEKDLDQVTGGTPPEVMPCEYYDRG